jgi:acyl carrier protein
MKEGDEKILYEIISKILDIPIDNINDDSSPDTIEAWDSLTHLNLIMAIEFEFKIKLSPEDSMDMLSVRLIKIILEPYLQ